jgi:integrase
VSVSKALLAKLRAWRGEHSGTHYVFGTRGDLPNQKFLDALKADWRRAGMNCGRCEGCKTKDECEKAYLHKFRSTGLTTLSRHVSAFQVQSIAGHRDPATTRRYVADAGAAEMQGVMDRAFVSSTSPVTGQP